MNSPGPVNTKGDLPVLTFTLGEQYYALLVDDVIEVASMVELVQVADSRPEVLGIANRHGAALPILDLRILMGQKAKPIDPSTLFIVVKNRDTLFGLVVDEVQQVEYFPAEEMKKSTVSGQYIRGIISNRQRLIQVIAFAPLLSPYMGDVAADDWLKVET